MREREERIKGGREIMNLSYRGESIAGYAEQRTVLVLMR